MSTFQFPGFPGLVVTLDWSFNGSCPNGLATLHERGGGPFGRVDLESLKGFLVGGDVGDVGDSSCMKRRFLYRFVLCEIVDWTDERVFCGIDDGVRKRREWAIPRSRKWDDGKLTI